MVETNLTDKQDIRIKYIESLTKDELRFELDKIYARIKEIQMLEEIQGGFPKEFLILQVNILSKDMERLNSEKKLYEKYYFK